MAVHVKDLLDLFSNEMGDLIQALVEQYRLPEQEALRLWQLPEEERAGAIADIVERGLEEAQYGPPYGPPVVPGEPNLFTTPIVQLIPKPTGVQTTQDFSETMFSPDIYPYSNIEIPQLPSPDIYPYSNTDESSIPSLMDYLGILGSNLRSRFGTPFASKPVADSASTYSDAGSYMGSSGSPGTLGVTGTPQSNEPTGLVDMIDIIMSRPISTEEKINDLLSYRIHYANRIGGEDPRFTAEGLEAIEIALNSLGNQLKMEQGKASGGMTEYQRAALANQNAQLAWAKEQAAMQDAWNREKFAQEQLWKQQTDKMDRETAMKNELQRIREARASMQISGATAMSNAAARQAEILGELAKYAVGDRTYWPGYEPGGIVQNRNAAWGMPFTPQKFTVTPVNVNVTGVAQDLVNKALAGIQ